MVFAGFGISAPQSAATTTTTATCSGKIVLALDHEPGERDPNSPFDGVVTSEAVDPWRKALAAQEKGAVAVLFVSDVHNHPGPANFEADGAQLLAGEAAAHRSATRWPRGPIASAFRSRRFRRRSPRRSSPAPARRSRISRRRRKPRAASTPLAAAGRRASTLHTAVDRHIVPDRNVVALLEGSDPQLKNEWVIVSAHFDHNGADGTQIFNGADDNGSGTVALIEIAEAYALAAKEGHRPKRSVLFAAWNSEERGLLGAWAYTEQPLAPLTTIAGGAEHGHDRPQRGDPGRRRRALRRPRRADRGVEQQRAST